MALLAAEEEVRAGSVPATLAVRLNSERNFAENTENLTIFPHVFYMFCLGKPRK